MPSDSERTSHWDLLLEKPTGLVEALLTFSALTPPEKWANVTIVQQLPDHRPYYLDYQGPVSGNRGNVIRVLNGTIQWCEYSEKLLIATVQFAMTHVNADKIHFELSELKLKRLSDHVGDGSQWELTLNPRVESRNGKNF